MSAGVHTTNGEKAVKVQLAVAVALAASTVAVAAPAQAACGQFAFDGFTALNQSNGYRLEWNATGPSVNAPVTAFNNHQAIAGRGTISGAISGRAVDFNVLWDSGGGGHYTGAVDDSGKARGDTVAGTPDANGDVSSASWNIRDNLVCSG
jgi:hypothetical protein